MKKDKINEFSNYYLKHLGTKKGDDAYFALIEAPHDIVPLLIKAFRIEKRSTIRSKLIEIIWQHRLPQTVEFLSEALNDTEPEVWKSALDGFVTLGNKSAVETLENAKKYLKEGKRNNERLKWIDEAIKQINEQSTN